MRDKLNLNIINWKPVPRLIIWLVILLLCVVFSGVVWNNTKNIDHSQDTVSASVLGDTPISLAPGDVLKQKFIIRGRIGGLWNKLHMEIFAQDTYRGSVRIRLLNAENGEELLCTDLTESQLRDSSSFTLDFKNELFMPSGKYFVIEITNNSLADEVQLYCNSSLQTGTLLLNDQQRNGFLNFAVTRIDIYQPSILFYIALFVANVTVLIGSAMVLFKNIKVHFLYLILAIGFGFVTLFDLTPLYGFDMRFHFDSTYVLSNQLLGMEGTIETPSIEDPQTNALSYYRRAGDDYTFFAHYYFDFVSSNYVDTYEGLRHLRASEADQDLVLVETYQNNLGEPYLYLPQAIGFTVARLLGLSFYPMLQLGRAACYSVFVLLVFLAIKQIPFGKGLFLILALIPATLVQTVSITRDALIIGMAFFVTAKVFAMACSENDPKALDWIILLAVSALLAPSKMAYVPVSFLWLLILYRRYLQTKRISWKKFISIVLLMAIPILLGFLLVNVAQIARLTQPGKKDILGTVAYSVKDILQNPTQIIYVIANTLRNQTGTYLTNAIQLFDIRLGSDEGITLLVFLLLILEIGSAEQNRRLIRPLDRGFSFAIFAATVCLITLGSILWTPNTSNVILGLQGRYITPVLPLLCLTFFNNKTFLSTKHSALLVKLGCCVFPAIALMNMYLWTIGKADISFEAMSIYP